MPTYDYQCRACGAVTEVIHSMLENGPSVCEVCGGALRRVLYPTGIIFKGPGFYSTDSRSSSSSSSTDTSSNAPQASTSSDTKRGGDGGSAPTADTPKPKTKDTASD